MKNNSGKACFSALIMLVLIFDSKTAISGMISGLSVCLQSLIPSLFPFLIISKYLNSVLMGNKIKVLSPVAAICKVPAGMESLLGIGLIGGYPIGAQCIYEAYNGGYISAGEASRLLGFCNNAGPAFVFGMCAGLFHSSTIGWVTCLIQIISALCVGIILPSRKAGHHRRPVAGSCSIISALESAIRSMASICGWVIASRIAISYLEKYLFISNPIGSTILRGCIELSNGCLSLQQIASSSCRLVLLNAMLSLGGLCVWIQTASVAKKLNLTWFYIGKLTQCCISIALSAFLTTVLFSVDDPLGNYTIGIICILVIAVEAILIRQKKVLELFRGILYNHKKKQETGIDHAIS